MSLKDAADITVSFATAAGIVAGGVFAYYKFIKDRIYRPRVNLGLKLEQTSVAQRTVLVCRAELASAGGAKLKLPESGKALVLCQGNLQQDPFKVVWWGPSVAVSAIFYNHAWLKSAETVHDVVAFTLPAPVGGIYRVELRVVVKKGFFPGRLASVSTFETIVIDP